MSMPTAERIEPTEQAAAAPRLGDMLLSAQKLSRHDLERALEVVAEKLNGEGLRLPSKIVGQAG